MNRYEGRLLALIALGLCGAIGFSQTAKVEGMIKSRSGATMTVQRADSTTIVVVLTDNTSVGQNQGVLKVRHKDMSMAALIPGLQIQVEGTTDAQGQLVAKSVKFDGNDLERALSIQAGLHQTQAQADRNSAELDKQQELLIAGHEKIDANKSAIDANKTAIGSNKSVIDAAIARFGQLDDYYILDEVTVLFANGKTDFDARYKPQLTQLAEKAKQTEAFMIQVIGYASSVGSAALNQKLSEERASNVTNFLIQDANIPLTNVLAPGAMGESRQIGDETTEQGQAENRRVVARILQNKGIAAQKDGQ